MNNISKAKARKSRVLQSNVITLSNASERSTALTPQRRRAAGSLAWVSSEAIQLASRLAEQHGLADFDVEAANDALAYERDVEPDLARLRASLRGISDSLLAKREAPARQTLAVYASLKSLARFRSDPELLESIAMLGELIAPRRSKRKEAPVPAEPLATIR